MATSQNGWPSGSRQGLGVKNYLVPGSNTYFACAPLAAPVLIAFAAEFHANIEPIDKGTWDDWGWSAGDNRGIAASQSNHASGTAIDINAVQHPFSKIGTFNPVKAVKIRLLAKKYGLRWGGDYTHTKDEMHFEIVESVQAVKARTLAMKLPTPKEKQ